MPNTGFQVIVKQRKSCPAFVCEECGEVIGNHDMAVVVWARGAYDEGERVLVAVVCKNDCSGKPPYRDMPWQPMRHFLVRLGYNSGLDTEAKVRRAWESAEHWQHT
jgi:hypothetical protein